MRSTLWLQVGLLLFINFLKVSGLKLFAGACQKVNDTIYFLGATKLVGEEYLFPNTRIYSLDLSKGFHLEKDDAIWETVYDGDKGIDTNKISSIYLPESQSIMSIAKENGKNTTINYYNIPESRWIPDQKASNAFDKFVNNMNKDHFHSLSFTIIRNEMNENEFFVIGGVVIFPEIVYKDPVRLDIKKKTVDKVELMDDQSLRITYPFIISYKGGLHYFGFSEDAINTKKMIIYNYTTSETKTKDIKGDNPQVRFSSFIQVKNLVYFIVSQIDGESKKDDKPIVKDPNIYILNLDTFNWEKHMVNGFIPYGSNCFVKQDTYLVYFNPLFESGEFIQVIDIKRWKKVTKLPSKEEFVSSPEINKENETKNKNESTILDTDKIVLIVLGSLLSLALLIILTYFIYSKYSKIN